MQQHATKPQDESASGLWQRVRDGDRSAFSSVMDICGPEMLVFLRNRLPSATVAEDLSQEVWLRA